MLEVWENLPLSSYKKKFQLEIKSFIPSHILVSDDQCQVYTHKQKFVQVSIVRYNKCAILPL